jgi:ABC-type glycerol-3-phosphate transport system substrate-binding protein
MAFGRENNDAQILPPPRERHTRADKASRISALTARSPLGTVHSVNAESMWQESETMPTTVRFMQEEYFPRQRAAIESFMAARNLDVHTDFLPVDPFWHDARSGFGTPPVWDLLVPDEVIVAEQMVAGRLEPLGAHAEAAGIDLESWLPAGIDRFRQYGELYAIPYVAMSNVLIYRQDMLDRYDSSVPATWDELRSAALAAQAALRRDGINDVAGFTSRGLGGYGHNFWIVGSTLLPSWGWEWNRGPGEPPLVDQPEVADAVGLYAALLREAGPPRSETLTFTDTHALYSAGKAVFLIDAATELATMRREGPESAGNMSGMTLVPSGPTGRPEPGLYSPSYCIPATSTAKDAAWSLLAHLISPEEMARDTFDGGYAEPPRQSIVESDEYAGAFGTDYQEVILATRELARINRPLIPNGFDLGEIVGAAVERVIAGEQSATEAITAAQREIDQRAW